MNAQVWVPWLVALVAAALGIPVARWLRLATYRKPDELDDPLPGGRWWVPGVLGVVSGLVVWRVWFVEDEAVPTPWVAGVLTATLLLVVLACVCLAAMDMDVHRLPDRIMWPTMGLLAGGTVLAALVGGGFDPWLRSVLAGVASGGFYLALALLSLARGSLALGLGDVKLSVVLGAALGWFGWPEALSGVYAGFLVGGVVAVVLLLGRRVRWEGHFAYGPPMMVGALLGLLATPGLLGSLF
ncbi:prepilin peptidase [Ornithinimicrobium tianjinense]|uniref:Prepilin type IV endopeptidase peptidase domain-containing protein n=1 Tax=Ornithinimicrobium tianjinense TaxID=1195761 RepID=A0A917BLS1_9MICO|nr:prepilin peptidase [Ornithinimicrobium tianjinense]GGF48543.1 hypothetical protein GCM10011366_15470 [Ornithinimicrobium tianjinense]